MAVKSLDTMQTGSHGRVVEISKCCNARKRLCELGLNKGADVIVVKNDFGPIILNLSGNKLAIGRRLADNIMVDLY